MPGNKPQLKEQELYEKLRTERDSKQKAARIRTVCSLLVFVLPRRRK